MNILIVGAGDIGYHLSRRLALEKHNITMVDSDPKRVEHARERHDALVVQGSGASYETLMEAGLENADILAALSNNDEVNILACQIAKKVGVPRTIARVRNPEFASRKFIFKSEELGIDFLIQPEVETAKSIIRLIRQSNATDVVDFDDGRMQLIGIRLDKEAKSLGEPLKSLGSDFADLKMRVLAIKRRQFTIIPGGDDILVAGDQIFITCDPDHIEQALRYFGKKDVKIDDVMIIGGGLIGGFIAKKLEKELNVKVLEINEKKAELLAGKLSNTLVLHGDGSDVDLLNFESLSEMDEFVAVTGDDEANIITCLIAKHMKVPRTVALVGKLDYLSLTPTLGLDSVICKQFVAVNEIVKFIRRQQVANYAEIPGLDAEIVEFIAKEKSKIIKKPLSKIGFPNHAIVGAVIKKTGAEIPRGDTQIDPGDRVIVFTLPGELKRVERLF